MVMDDDDENGDDDEHENDDDLWNARDDMRGGLPSMTCVRVGSLHNELNEF